MTAIDPLLPFSPKVWMAGVQRSLPLGGARLVADHEPVPVIQVLAGLGSDRLV